MSSSDVSPWIVRGVVLYGGALVAATGIDLFTAVAPLRFGDLQWRYGFLGVAAGYLLQPTLGLGVIVGTAIWSREPTSLRIGGWAALLLGLTLVVAMAVFALDVLAIREVREAEVRGAVLLGGMLQEVKYLLAVSVLLMLWHGSLKTAKRLARGR